MKIVNPVDEMKRKGFEYLRKIGKLNIDEYNDSDSIYDIEKNTLKAFQDIRKTIQIENHPNKYENEIVLNKILEEACNICYVEPFITYSEEEDEFVLVVTSFNQYKMIPKVVKVFKILYRHKSEFYSGEKVDPRKLKMSLNLKEMI